MALYQTSVLKNYLKRQDAVIVNKAYKKYVKYFHNSTIQENIKKSKEEEYQGIFLTELFVNILGYTLNPMPNFNLVAEKKNQSNSQKADGAILKNKLAVAVIELKGTKTKDLESIRKQAFDYKANQKECVYVITSNYEKLRFYINDATEFEEFNLFTLTDKEFELLYLCLNKENILGNLPLKIKEESVTEEEKITKSFYADYSLFKRELYRDLVKQNGKELKLIRHSELGSEEKELQQFEKNVKLTLFKKSQKLIDRFLFIFFAEDRDLLPPNSTIQILDKWKSDMEFGDERPLYNLFKQYFNYLDSGRKQMGKRAEIYAYNGGLFKPDVVLDSVKINDELLYKHSKALAKYDFESQVDVNILGHIFENSLNEIESVNAEIEGSDFDKQKSKRKKDGVFYTPKYITKYIVENTIGKLCIEKKLELGFKEEEYYKSRKGRQQVTLENLIAILDSYRAWLLKLTICDPACGSGAFLNQALDFLIKEHRYIDELKAQLLGGGLVFSDIENTILENNIYGVDLNEESVEIAKLSLWLRTAQPKRKLNDLSSNIKCGNSLIDSKAVAGDKAFNWQQEFPQIFKEKNKKAFHITTAVHDSRTSQRMIDFKVREKRDLGTNPYPNINYFTEEDEFVITQTIANIIKDNHLNVLAYNICADHIHLLLVCEEENAPIIMQLIKGKTARAHNSNNGINPLVQKENEKSVPLWTQKFGCKEIITKEHLFTAIDYIKHNRSKHNLPQHSNKGFKPLVENFVCDYKHAFRQEYKGGFDVIIGNPPYVNLERMKEVSLAIEKMGYETYNKRGDLYILFVEKGFNLIKEKGIISYIMPNKWLQAGYGKNLREYFLTKELIKLIDFGDLQIFEGATTYPCIFIAKNNKPKANFSVSVLKSTNSFDFDTIVTSAAETFEKSQFSGDTWVISSNKESQLLNRFEKFTTLSKFINNNANRGIIPGLSEAFIINNELKNVLVEKDSNSNKIIGKILRGRDLSRYGKPTKNSLENIILASFGSYKYLENEYPAIYNHLIQYEDKLKKRGQCNGSKETSEKPFTGQHHWLELDNTPLPNYLNLFSKPKIMYQVFQVKPCFIFDEQNLYCNNSMWIIPTDNKALLGVLNSKMGWWLITKYCTQIQNGCQLIWKYFGQIPIPELSNSKLTISVENIISSNEELQEVSQKFQRALEREFAMESLPKKLQDWYLLSFGEFIKELEKKKVKLSLSQKAEWEDYFLQESKKALALKTNIDTTDKEIDQMVYGLYGLTEEEIEIVENS